MVTAKIEVTGSDAEPPASTPRAIVTGGTRGTGAAAFLAPDTAASIAGADIVIDGGTIRTIRTIRPSRPAHPAKRSPP